MSSIKGSVLDGAKAASESRTQMRCGDCLHFQGSAHPAIGQKCEDRGVKKFATAPSCFTANVHVFRRTAPDAFNQLASIISGFTASQSRVLMGLLSAQAQLERNGYYFLERIYFKVGNDYLDNYFSAFVLGIGPEKQILVVGSDYLKNQKGTTVAKLLKESILSEKEFIQVRDRLVAKGLIYEPRRPHKNEIQDAAEYEPPTLETSAALLEKNANKSTNPKKKPKRAKRETDSEQGENTFEVDLS